MRTLFWILFALLLLVRAPSLVQPAGGDQGLYAYVGERILAGELPYRDAWDQKPPGIHYTYALLYAIHPDLSVVPAADLVVAAITAWLLLVFGRRIGPPGSGELAALLFLLYTNPALARLGGVRVRAQCEVFIALFTTAAFLLVERATARTRTALTVSRPVRPGAGGSLALLLLAGACLGLSFVYKYNAGIYLPVALLCLVFWTRSDRTDRASLTASAGDLRLARPRALGVESTQTFSAAPVTALGSSRTETPEDVPEWDLPLDHGRGEAPADDWSHTPPPAPALAEQTMASEPDLALSTWEAERPTEPLRSRRTAQAESHGDLLDEHASSMANEPAASTPRPATTGDGSKPFAHRRPATLAELFPLALWLIVGFASIVALLIGYFAAAGALQDLYDATIAYNMFYSGETYTGRLDMLKYLITFPVQHARVEALWFLGGLGCLVLLTFGWRRPRVLIVPIWVAAACVSIAVNGKWGYPQYFLQAGPALALAAGIAAALVWPWLRWPIVGPLPRIVLIAIVAFGAWRVQDFHKAIDYTLYDLHYWQGRIPHDEYLSRFGERASDEKYSALAVDELGRYLAANVPADEHVLHFGFSQGALAQAHRVSATRFFWSRPVIVRFKDGTPGYGVAGLLDELARTRPYEVVLQRRDWDPINQDSASFFLGEPDLANWLRAHYQPAREMGNFLMYRRNGAPPPDGQ